jgi:hypothetical protein
MNTSINLQFKKEEPMKKLNFMNAKNSLDRDEMKKIMAGSSIGGGGGGGAYVICCGCQNSTCRGHVADCSPASVYPICGPGPAGGNGPCATCYPS